MNTKIDYPNGDIYIGDVDENGLPHGKGVMRYKQQSYGKWLGYQVCYKEYPSNIAPSAIVLFKRNFLLS